ncbi:MAG: hypothetical protein ACE367_13730 [Acidimicrobiales bacterium]
MTAFFAATALFASASAAAAQVEQSDIGSQQGGLESSQLITSNAEVRRAVIGLLVIAGIAFLVFVVYWALTGRAAKARFAREFGGRHAVDPRPRRGRRRSAAVSGADDAATAVAPGAVEPPRRRVQAQAMPTRPAPAEEPRIHAGWVDPSGRRRVPVKVHPAWVDQSAPAPARATVARHAAPTHDPERPWRGANDGPWPTPFEGR